MSYLSLTYMLRYLNQEILKICTNITGKLLNHKYQQELVAKVDMDKVFVCLFSGLTYLSTVFSHVEIEPSLHGHYMALMMNPSTS